MLSIITGIYNQLSVNEIFYEALVECTSLPFELIVVDNNSTDGSHDYFKEKDNVTIINTGANFNYPYCQNLGIKYAKYDLLCFFNNDAIPSKEWDIRMIDILYKNIGIEALSFASNDHLANIAAHRKISKRWKRIKYPIQYTLGNTKFALKLMLKLMYGDLNKFGDARYKKFKDTIADGYSGSVIVLKRKLIDKIGLWDERIQGADYDLYNRIKEYSLKHPETLPLRMALGIYFHHYQRLTVKVKYPPFANLDQMVSIEDKWGDKTKELRKDINQ